MLSAQASQVRPTVSCLGCLLSLENMAALIQIFHISAHSIYASIVGVWRPHMCSNRWQKPLSAKINNFTPGNFGMSLM